MAVKDSRPEPAGPRAAEPDRGSRASDPRPPSRDPRDPQEPGEAPNSAHQRQNEGGLDSGGGIGRPDSDR
jgi:hypothetical protein